MTKEEKLRFCKLIRAGSKYMDTGNPYIDSKSLLKYKGRAWDSRFWCCRHTKKGGRMYTFGLKELAPGGDSYNRKRNGKELWLTASKEFFICANCERVESRAFTSSY